MSPHCANLGALRAVEAKHYAGTVGRLIVQPELQG